MYGLFASPLTKLSTSFLATTARMLSSDVKPNIYSRKYIELAQSIAIAEARRTSATSFGRKYLVSTPFVSLKRFLDASTPTTKTHPLTHEESEALHRWEMQRYISFMDSISARIGSPDASSWELNLAQTYQNTQQALRLITSKSSESAELVLLVKKGILLSPDERCLFVNHAVQYNDPSLLESISEQIKSTNPSVDLIRYWTDTRGTRDTKGKQMALLGPIVKAGAYHVLDFFVAKGFDVTVSNEVFTLLHNLAIVLSHENHLITLEHMLKAGALVNAVDLDWHYSALLRVITLCKKPEIALKAVQLLLEYGADPDLCDTGDRSETALHKAVQINDFNIALYLLDNGYHKVDVNALNSEGCNAAHILFQKEAKVNVLLLQQLINHGIDVKIQDGNGLSVIDYLEESGLTEQVVLPSTSLSL